MTRTKWTIIGAGLPTVEKAVSDASAQIIASAPHKTDWTIVNAWDILTASGGINWTSVMTSKTLHFMSRALGVVDDCPIPLDGEIIKNTLWPSFNARVDNLRLHHGILGPRLPSIRQDRSFSSYNRYMTAILVWRNRKNNQQEAAGGGLPPWTTTDVETTLFQMNPIHWI